MLAEVDTLQGGDIDGGGRAFSPSTTPTTPPFEALLHEVANRYLHESALNRSSTRASCRWRRTSSPWRRHGLLGTDPEARLAVERGTPKASSWPCARPAAGATGGAWRRRTSSRPTVHPAFAKACHYLRIEHRRVPVGPDLRADVEAMAALIDDNTVLLVSGATCCPYGVIDPIPALGQVALAHDLPCCTSTPASVAGCCPGGSASASRCRRGTRVEA
ncbi:MAG: hypothetical protein R2690_16570 [Acidimicrobiales bacterium]